MGGAKDRDEGSAASAHEKAIRENYARVCRCEYDDQDGFEVLVYRSDDCVIHGTTGWDPLSVLLDENQELRGRLRAACEPCAECGHIDWRELDDILEAK